VHYFQAHLIKRRDNDVEEGYSGVGVVVVAVGPVLWSGHVQLHGDVGGDGFIAAVRDSVPVTFELERARKMIAALEPEIGRHKREIAREELDLRKLDEKDRQGP
jgi:hypothetical protein